MDYDINSFSLDDQVALYRESWLFGDSLEYGTVVLTPDDDGQPALGGERGLFWVQLQGNNRKEDWIPVDADDFKERVLWRPRTMVRRYHPDFTLGFQLRFNESRTHNVLMRGILWICNQVAKPFE